MKYNIPVTYSMCGAYQVEADSMEEAQRIALEDMGLPDNAEYIDSSMEVNEGMLEHYNNPANKKDVEFSMQPNGS